MAACFIHPEVDATGACDDCKKPICAQCTKGTLEGLMCPACAEKRYGRRKTVTYLKIGGLVAMIVALAVVGLVMVTQKNKDAVPKPAAAVAPQGEQDPFIESLRAERDRAPCDQDAVRKLVTELSKVKRHAEAVTDANAYFAKCAPFPRLKWDLIYSLQQLGRYAEAIKPETELIADNPFDSDFWWWRGEDRGRTGDNASALADYRQSFATSDDAGSAKFAAGRIIDVVGDRPCEGVAALDFFVAVDEGDLGENLEAKARGLDVSAQCGAKRGTGTLEIPVPADGAVKPVKVVIGGVEGKFVIEEQCGTTALTTAFADRAKVVARPGPKIQTVASGAIHDGGLATATLVIGKATAPDTEVAIVDALPDGVDGVIGLSALWKFELIRRDDGGLTLEGHGTPAGAPAGP